MLCPFLVGFKHKCVCVNKMLCSLMDLLLRSNNMKTSNKPICKIISERNNASLYPLNKMFCLIACDLKYINYYKYFYLYSLIKKLLRIVYFSNTLIFSSALFGF